MRTNKLTLHGITGSIESLRKTRERHVEEKEEMDRRIDQIQDFHETVLEIVGQKDREIAELKEESRLLKIRLADALEGLPQKYVYPTINVPLTELLDQTIEAILPVSLPHDHIVRRRRTRLIDSFVGTRHEYIADLLRHISLGNDFKRVVWKKLSMYKGVGDLCFQMLKDSIIAAGLCDSDGHILVPIKAL